MRRSNKVLVWRNSRARGQQARVSGYRASPTASSWRISNPCASRKGVSRRFTRSRRSLRSHLGWRARCLSSDPQSSSMISARSGLISLTRCSTIVVSILSSRSSASISSASRRLYDPATPARSLSAGARSIPAEGCVCVDSDLHQRGLPRPAPSGPKCPAAGKAAAPRAPVTHPRRSWRRRSVCLCRQCQQWRALITNLGGTGRT